MFYSPLKHSLYRSIWLATLCSNIGTWIHTVTASLLMAKLTSSVTLIALVQTTAMLPILLFAIPGGVLGDFYDRKTIVIYTYSFMSIIALLMAIVTYAGYMTDWMLLSSLFLLSTGLALNQPASQAIISTILPKDEVKQAAVLANLSFNFSRSIGPAIAGFFFASLGAACLFTLNAISFLGIIFVFRAKVRSDEKSKHPFAFNLLTRGFRDGWMFLKKIPLFRFIVCKSTWYFTLASSVFALLPYIIIIHNKMSDHDLGLLTGAIGVGAVINASLFHRLRLSLSDHKITTSSMFITAFTILGLNQFHSFALLMINMLIFGCAWSMAISTFNGTLQADFPNQIRSRLVGIYFASFAAAQAMGAYFSGHLVDYLGVTQALSLISIAMLVISLYYYLANLPDYTQTLLLSQDT